MQLVALPVAGGGGRKVHVNPAHVVCVIDVGDQRTQVVTTGLSGETSMSIVVHGSQEEVVEALTATGLCQVPIVTSPEHVSRIL